MPTRSKGARLGQEVTAIAAWTVLYMTDDREDRDILDRRLFSSNGKRALERLGNGFFLEI